MDANGKRDVTIVPAGDPSPSEIRRLCLEIQAGWSDRERRARAGFYGVQQPVELQRFDADGGG